MAQEIWLSLEGLIKVNVFKVFKMSFGNLLAQHQIVEVEWLWRLSSQCIAFKLISVVRSVFICICIEFFLINGNQLCSYWLVWLVILQMENVEDIVNFITNLVALLNIFFWPKSSRIILIKKKKYKLKNQRDLPYIGNAKHSG